MSQERNGQSDIEEEKSNDPDDEQQQQEQVRLPTGENVKPLEDIPVFIPPQSFNLFSSLPFGGDNSELHQMFFPYNFHVGLIPQPPNLLFNSLFNQFVSQQSRPPQQQKDKYYKKRIIEVDNRRDQFQEDEPYLKISFIKQQEFQNDHYHIVNEFGLMNSQKNTDIDDIMIGRQNSIGINNEQIYPNDIVLPITDRAISRVHCKIITKQGFIQKYQKIQKDFFIFLIACKYNPLWAKLPQHIVKNIFDFSKQRPEFFIQDLGSQQGTYLKVKNNTNHPIQKGNSFFIGADVIFHTIASEQAEFIPEKLQQLFARIPSSQNNRQIQLHGLRDHEKACYERLNDPNIKVQLEQDIIPIKRPMLALEFHYGNHPNYNLEVFFGGLDKENQLYNTTYKFGRNQDSDVVIQFNTVSRKQCRVFYDKNENQWLISDGDLGRESANGTWLSVTNYYEKKDNQRNESSMIRLENESEIKISDSLLKFEMFNFSKTKPKYTKKQCAENNFKYIESFFQTDQGQQ